MIQANTTFQGLVSCATTLHLELGSVALKRIRQAINAGIISM